MYLPKVSIITPSFNQAFFLEYCIKSVLAQDYPNIEYIIIDGGSTDGSIEIIKKYEHRIKYWESKSDNGQSHAINKGFAKATGSIIAWLNSDDLYFPNAVSTAVRRFDENPDLTLFYGNCVFVDKNGSFIRYFTEIEAFNEDRLLNFSDFIMQPTTFFSSEMLKKVGYLDEKLHYTMDWDLWCKLSKAGIVYYENELIAANRDYENTKTNLGGNARLKEIVKIYKKHGTRIWPNSVVAYSSAELRNILSRSNNFFLIKLSLIISSLIHLFIPSVILFSLKNKNKRNLFGFIPYSYFIPDGKAEIHIPLTGDEKFVEIGLNENSNSKQFIINGEFVATKSLRIEINSVFHDRKILSIYIEIKSEKGERCSGRIDYVDLLRQTTF